MTSERAQGWANPWVRRSVASLAALTTVAILVGFIWLPSVHSDFTAQGLWASICRAAGVPARWSSATGIEQGPRATDVILERTMTRGFGADAVGRGATLALNCTMCHGAQGMSASDAPNLAGQFPEVIIKQLRDYQGDKRESTIMQSLAKGLSAGDIDDLAAYYASLPKARTAPTTYDETLPALVRVGDPLRNIAPCIACHGQTDQKLGAPWLEGMPKAYVVSQLSAFKSGARRNDPEAQMRNMVRAMTSSEIDQVAAFYAGKAPTGQPN
jgi:cytochrome c553